MVRAGGLRLDPAIARTLNPVFRSLTTAKLHALDAEITIEEKPERDVATRYLDGLGSAGPGSGMSP
ncbi:hypothetical protein [Microvirga sp. TS319]|uniref:hypothetical protein n=1 Tax=Microvirga sp. TS319 TaxID=3241165 RepID=UPI00351A4DF9